MKLLLTIIFFSTAIILKPVRMFGQGKYSIQAEIIGKKLSQATLVLYDTTFKQERKFAITGNRFEISGTIDVPFFCKISFPELPATIDFILDSGATTLTISIDSIQTQGYKIYIAKVINDSVSVIQNQQKVFMRKLSSISEDTTCTQITKGNLMFDIFKRCLAQNPNYLYLAQVFPEIDYFSSPQANEIFTAFNPRLKAIANKFGVVQYLERTAKTAVGATYKDFLEKDSLNRVVSIDSLQYKYLLIDFGASNCGPCRKQFPQLKQFYSQYHTKGFEILGSYLEFDRKEWLKSVVQDQIPWITVSSLNGNGAKVARYYGLTYIPFNILIDDKKQIIGKNYSPAELSSFLGQMLR